MNLLSPDVLDAEVARLVAELPVIRPLHAGDRPLLEALMRGLSPASRYLRFHAAVSEVPAALLERLTRVGVLGESAFLATTGVQGRELAVGEARLAISDEVHDAHEFALVVADPWQRLGVGMALMQRLLRQAALSGVRALFGDTFSNNVRMLELARRLGFEMHRHPTDARLTRMSVRLDGSQQAVPTADTARAADSLAA
jgi:acetyltransferase